MTYTQTAIKKENTIIAVENLHKSYQQQEVLRGVSLEAQPGDVVVLLGASGGGKSTLLRCLNFLTLPDEGQYFFHGKPLPLNQKSKGALCNKSEKCIHALRSKMGMVFQQFHLWPHLTVLENIMEAPLVVLKQNKNEVLERALNLLKKVDLEDKAHSYPAQLSGGQQQRVENEEEADRIGMDVLYKAGFNPKSMSAFFERLAQTESLNGSQAEILSSHPLTQDRISDSENRAAKYPAKQYTSSLDYYLIRSRLRVQTSTDSHALLEFFQKNLQSKHYLNADAEQYGLGLALLRVQQSQKAYDIFAELEKNNPTVIDYQLALARAAYSAGRYDESVKLTENIYKNNPNSYPAFNYYIAALLQDKQYEKALNLIQRHRLSYPDDPVPYLMLSQAQAKSGYMADAYQSRAKYFTANGMPMAAMDQLKMALALPNNSKMAVEKINAQMQEIQRTMPEKG